MPDRIEQMQDVARALAGTANQMLIAATAGDTERVCDLRNKLIAELTSRATAELMRVRERYCRACGTPFEGKRRDSWYCCRRCAHRDYKRIERRLYLASISTGTPEAIPHA